MFQSSGDQKAAKPPIRPHHRRWTVDAMDASWEYLGLDFDAAIACFLKKGAIWNCDESLQKWYIWGEDSRPGSLASLGFLLSVGPEVKITLQFQFDLKFLIIYF